jgi:hypothetical protein
VKPEEFIIIIPPPHTPKNTHSFSPFPKIFGFSKLCMYLKTANSLRFQRTLPTAADFKFKNLLKKKKKTKNGP